MDRRQSDMIHQGHAVLSTKQKKRRQEAEWRKFVRFMKHNPDSLMSIVSKVPSIKPAPAIPTQVLDDLRQAEKRQRHIKGTIEIKVRLHSPARDHETQIQSQEEGKENTSQNATSINETDYGKPTKFEKVKLRGQAISYGLDSAKSGRYQNFRPQSSKLAMNRGNELGIFRNREVSSSIRDNSGLNTNMQTIFYKNCESFEGQAKRPDSSNYKSLGMIVGNGRRLQSGNPIREKRVRNQMSSNLSNPGNRKLNENETRTMATEMTSQAKNTLLQSQLGAESNDFGDIKQDKMLAIHSIKSSLDMNCLDPIAEKVRRQRVNITGLQQQNTISQANLRGNLQTITKKRSIVSAKHGSRRKPHTNGFATLASSGAQSSKNASTLATKFKLNPKLFGMKPAKSINADNTKFNHDTQMRNQNENDYQLRVNKAATCVQTGKASLEFANEKNQSELGSDYVAEDLRQHTPKVQKRAQTAFTLNKGKLIRPLIYDAASQGGADIRLKSNLNGKSNSLLLSAQYGSGLANSRSPVRSQKSPETIKVCQTSQSSQDHVWRRLNVQALQDKSKTNFSNFEITNRNRLLKQWTEKKKRLAAIRRRNKLFNLSKQLSKMFDVQKPQTWAPGQLFGLSREQLEEMERLAELARQIDTPTAKRLKFKEWREKFMGNEDVFFFSVDPTKHMAELSAIVHSINQLKS